MGIDQSSGIIIGGIYVYTMDSIPTSKMEQYLFKDALLNIQVNGMI